MRHKAVWLEQSITEGYSEFEYLLYTIYFHAGPAIAGQKTGTMLSFTPSGRNLMAVWRRYSDAVTEALPAAYKVLRETEKGITVLFYQPEAMKARLEAAEVRDFLRNFAYPLEGVDVMLTCLTQRFDKGCPHEIGVFLGYPIEDIQAFMSDNCHQCLMTGYWKVYANPENALAQFRLYDKVRHRILALLKKGISPLSLHECLEAA